MSKAITLESFAKLQSKEKESYFLEIAQLEDFWLIGKVKKPFEDKPFFFIEQLLNPYTGGRLNSQIFSDYNRSLSIYCPTKEKDFYDNGTLVATKIMFSVSEEKIKKGELLNTTLQNIYPIETSDEIFNLIGFKKEDLGILALAKPILYRDNDTQFVDLVTDIIKKKIEQDEIKLNRKIEENNQQIKYIQRQEEKLEETKTILTYLQKELENLGFKLDTTTKESEGAITRSFLETPSTFIDLLKKIQIQLKLRGYVYEEPILRQLLLSLTTEKMIILLGPSGTGKTTIIKQLAEIINAKYEIIPVQPSWSDKQDLLGFYNPIRKLFVPSAFLDCLIEAQKNPDQIYFICLDEINLAQIEYYLADLLSIRELGDGKIRLYSDFEYQQNMDEIQWFIQRNFDGKTLDNDIEIKNIQKASAFHFELITRYKNLRRYTPTIAVPKNVYIIGTMNVEGNVQPLSPKVIDRSFIIPVYHQNADNLRILTEEVGQYNISPKYFTNEKNGTTEISSSVRSAIYSIKNELNKWNIEYNQRFENHFFLYSSAAEYLGFSAEQIIDDITVMKILPRLHEMVDDEHLFLELTNVITNHTKNQLMSRIKLEKMHERFKSTNLYSYWS